MNIIFIRHGETTGDIENRYGGAYDDELSTGGMQQSQVLASQLKDIEIQRIYSSPFIRAKDTAQALAKANGVTDIQIRDGLKERNQYGVLTGVVKTEAAQTHPHFVELLKDKMNVIEGAESYEHFRDRIIESIQTIVSESQQGDLRTVAIVWHGGPMRVLFRDFLKWGELSAVENCAWSELAFEGGVWNLLNSNGVAFAFQR